MTEKRLIQGVPSTRRYLHSDEVFRKERNWNINLPNEREFKNGYCIVTDKEDTAYSIDELVELLNELHKENQQLKNNLSEIEKIINNRLDNNVVPKWSDGKTELFVEEKVGYWHALAQLKKKLIRSELLFQNEKED